MKPTELDADGKTLAVTGEIPFVDGNGATGLSVTRPGSGRARLRGERAYAEEYAAIRAPVVTSAGVTTLFDQFTSGVATKFADFAAAERGFKERGTGGMQILRWARDGANAVFVEAPTDAGCIIGDLFSDRIAGPAPCRIVRADLASERVLPPRISINGLLATVLRTTVRGATITGRLGVAGVTVEVRDGPRSSQRSSRTLWAGSPCPRRIPSGRLRSSRRRRRAVTRSTRARSPGLSSPPSRKG